jgi:hypothetical protein
VITDTLTRKGQRSVLGHLYLFGKRSSRCDSSVRTTPEALLRLIRQCWSSENTLALDPRCPAGRGRPSLRQPDRGPGVRLPAHRRDVDAVGRRPYLLRRGAYRSIRQGLRELAYALQEMLALGGVASRVSPT